MGAGYCKMNELTIVQTTQVSHCEVASARMFFVHVKLYFKKRNLNGIFAHCPSAKIMPSNSLVQMKEW